MEACGGRTGFAIGWRDYFVCMYGEYNNQPNIGAVLSALRQKNLEAIMQYVHIYANSSVRLIYLVGKRASPLNFGTPGARTLRYFEVFWGI